MKPLASCQVCPRFKAPLVPNEIIKNARMMVLGEAPGKEEREVGRPFVGKSGQMLNLLLAKSGNNRQLVSVVNTVCCFVEGNPTPTVEEIMACAPVVEAAIEEANPKVILAMGEIAKTRMVGKRSLTAWRGSIIEADGKVALGEGVFFDESDPIKSGPNKGKPRKKKRELFIEQVPGRTVVITNHPAELLYGGFSKWPLVQADVQRATRIALGKPLIEVGGSIRTHIRDTDVLERLLEANDDLVMDIESNRETGRITMVGIAPDKDHAYVCVPTRPILNLLGLWLADRRNTLIGHNVVGFDARKFQEYGLGNDCRFWDTYVAAHYERPDILRTGRRGGSGDGDDDENSKDRAIGKALSLDMVCSRLPTLRYYNWKEAFREGRDLDEWTYCGLDCCSEMFVKEELERRLTKTGQLSRFTNILMPLSKIVTRMEDDGIRIDEGERQPMLRAQERLSKGLLREWEALAPHTNPGSATELRRLFYGEMGLEPILHEQTGKPTLDRGALDELAQRHPEVPSLKVLRSLRHVEKMLSTYLRRETDGFGHAHFTTALVGTVTGRFSGDGQQIPKHSKDESCRQGVAGCCCGAIRRMFTFDRGDECLVVADYSQIEDRLTALLARETWMMKAFNDDSFDHHQVVADELTKLLGRPVSRDLAKKINHATNYGMGMRRLAKEVGCKEGEAKRFLASLKKIKPRIHEWRMKLTAKAEKEGFVANPFGRRLYFNGQVEMSKVTAFVPQSTAFDVIADAMIKVSESGLKLRMQIHDELVISGSRKDVRTLADAMEILHDALDGWYCPVEVAAGKNWLEGKKNGKRISR